MADLSAVLTRNSGRSAIMPVATTLNVAMPSGELLRPSDAASGAMTLLAPSLQDRYRITDSAAGALASSSSPNVYLKTSFTTAEGWTTDRFQVHNGLFNPPNNFTVQSGFGNGGSNTTQNGSFDGVLAAADNAAGAGGRGFRHMRGDGDNNNGGGLSFTLPTAVSELWVRWYMRYQLGFTFNPFQYTKDIYFHFLSSPIQILGFKQSGGFFYYADIDSDPRVNILSSITFAQINGGSTGDGQYHLYEAHMRSDTNGSNGVLELWSNEVRVLNVTNVNYAQATFSYGAIGSNQRTLSNGGVDVYTDFDDICFADGYIGPYNAARGF